MNKNLALMVAFVIVLIGGAFFLVQQNPGNTDTNPTEGKLQVVVSFYPLEHFAQQVGGERIEVTSLAPSGVEPHDYEPTPQDIITIRNANVFLVNGAGFEPWADKVIADLQSPVLVKEMADAVTLLSAQEHSEEESEEEHENTPFDPHIWLDPVLVREQVASIRDVFVLADPAHEEEYRANAAKYMNILSQMNSAYHNGLQSCAIREIVTSHNAFAYMAHEYNFEVHAIAGLSPAEEPSSRHLAQLTDLVREKNIKYIFTETLASPKFSETLARESGVQILTLNPIEGLTSEEKEQGKNYDSFMRENLAHLRRAMQCT
jgi:zinc transport system substrate-binding protein